MSYATYHDAGIYFELSSLPVLRTILNRQALGVLTRSYQSKDDLSKIRRRKDEVIEWVRLRYLVAKKAP